MTPAVSNPADGTSAAFESSPTLFPDFIDRLEPVHGGGTDRFKLWHLGPLSHKLHPPSDYVHMRGCLVKWSTWGDGPPWAVTLTHYHQIFVGEGRKRELRQRINSVERRFRDRASCAAFAERMLRRIEACESRWAAHYLPEEAP